MPTTNDNNDATTSAIPMDALSRLAELFGDRSVGELAIILDRHGNDVKEASWAILNGERAAAPDAVQQPSEGGEEGSDSSLPAAASRDSAEGGDKPEDDEEGDDLLCDFPSIDSPTPAAAKGAAPAEIQRLYDEGTITKDEYEEMVEADRKAAGHRESRRGGATPLSSSVQAALVSVSDGVDSTTDETDGLESAAPAAIQRLYDEGTITKDEYEEMVYADSKVARHRESSTLAPAPADGPTPAVTRRSSLITRRSSRLLSLGSKLAKLNLPRLIDQMEKDQEYADRLDFINREMAEEEDRMAMVRESERLALELMEEHLEEFLRSNPRAAYESWIEELHPDNVVEGKLLPNVGSTEIDHRFYVVDSDHRRLWNESLSERNDGDRRNYVSARSSSSAAAPLVTTSRRDGQAMRDLLGGSVWALNSEEAQRSGGGTFSANTDKHTEDIDLLRLDEQFSQEAILEDDEDEEEVKVALPDADDTKPILD